MKRNIVLLMVSVIIMMPAASAHAQTAEQTTLAETLQALMQQVEELQQRLAELRGEVQQVREEIKVELRQGMQSNEVEKLQELLASDPEIYPEGLQTGYFGTLTKGALIRFQNRHELEPTGEVDDVTREVLNQYFNERGDDAVPPGLLRAPGIRDKVERTIANNCHDGRGMAFLCKRLQDKFDVDDDVDEEAAREAIEDAKEEIEKAEEKISADEADGKEVALSQETLVAADEYLVKSETLYSQAQYGEAVAAAEMAEDLASDARMKFLGKTEADFDEDGLEIEVEIENEEATVEIEYEDGSEEEFVLSVTSEEEIIAAIVTQTKLTQAEVEAVITFERDDDDDDDDDDDNEEGDEDGEEDDDMDGR